MDTGSTYNEPPPHGPNGATGGPAAGVDPNAYRDPAGAAPTGPAGPEGPATAPVEPIPNGLIADLTARLTSMGIKDEAEVREFRRKYGEQLTQLFDALDFGDALAEYGITLGGAGGHAPAWVRVGGSVGGAALLLLMNRPEMLERMRTGSRSSAPSSEGEREPDPATTADPGGGARDGGNPDAN